MSKSTLPPAFDKAQLQQAFLATSWRGFVFRDLVINELKEKRKAGGKLVALDIGCGHGFDAAAEPQEQIAALCDELVGIEPDKDIAIPKYFHRVYASSFEAAPIEAQSVDVAFAVMVLEHLDQPKEFLAQLDHCLKPGGVFWGFTVDSRHWFARASNFLKSLGLKDMYLSMLHGNRGGERYENYPVHYRFNRPEQIEPLVGAFSRCDIQSLWRKNQTRFYFPNGLKWVGNSLDFIYGLFGRRGSVLVVRIQK
jgi:SAM-dependent methyltransferase